MKKVMTYILKAVCWGLEAFMLYVIVRGITDNTYELNRIIDKLADFAKVSWGYVLIAFVADTIKKDISKLIEKLNNK